MHFSEIKYNQQGLIPCIIQDAFTNQVLMLAYMNAESLQMTLETKYLHYYSRSRQKIWKKGETSGHLQELISFFLDCDSDTLLARVKQHGVACHTGAISCFFNPLAESRDEVTQPNILKELYGTIYQRKENPVEKSYTNYLFKQGVDKICKKIGEEATESVIAAKNNDNEELIYELSDLVYHAMVLMIHQGITLESIEQELLKRHSQKRKRDY